MCGEKRRGIQPDHESRPLKRLLWFLSCRSKKGTARRAGVKLREAAKLRPNYKHRTLRRTAERTYANENDAAIKSKAPPLGHSYS
jgi:hypothetical protein